ncbi:hypothetical protein FRB97_006613 [Tulasnella sp. 331]|nr:hypothetical protein FRB97_006613 [Tulasnella sp. 331]
MSATVSASTPTTSTVAVMPSAGAFLPPPSNALEAYLYPSLALGFGVATTIIVCRFIERRRRVRRAQAWEARVEARLAETLSSIPKIYDVAIEKQGSPYTAGRPRSYLWADLTPISGSLTWRDPQAGGGPSRPNPTSSRGNPLISAELGRSLLRDAFPLPANWRREPSLSFQPPAEAPPPYDTIVTGVIIAMPSDRSVQKLKNEAPDDDEEFPELVLGCVESDWQS